MWLFLPLYGRLVDAPFPLNRDWLTILLGVILLNGVAEEVIHRAFIFGHLRESRTFWASATISAAICAAQHIYLLFTIGMLAELERPLVVTQSREEKSRPAHVASQLPARPG